MRIYFGGGLNEQFNPTIHEAATGSQNFELSKDTYALKPRKPFDHKGTATNGLEVNGILQLIKRDDSETTLIQAGDTVYDWDGSSTFSSVGTVNATSKLRGNFWPLDDYLVVTDLEKLTVVKKWDGTTFSTQTTGLGADLYAKYSITFNGRVWLFNVKTGTTDVPHMMVACAFETPTSYDTTKRATDSSFTTGNEAFYMLTPDLRPINGVVLFKNVLIISTEGGKLFKLTGYDSTDYAFAQFYGGSDAAGDESIANMGNDVIYMKRGGNIESLTATQEFGDISVDDLSRYIPDTVGGLTGSITVYDQSRQKVYFFTTQKVIVLFKDILYGGAVVNENGERAKVSPWSVYKTEFGNDFTTNAASYIRIPGETEYAVYWGDSLGRVFRMDGIGSGDGGTTDIYVLRKTRLLDKQQGVNTQTHITRGNIRYRRLNECEFTMEYDWADEYNSSVCTINLNGPAAGSEGSYFGANIYFGEAVYFNGVGEFVNKIAHQNFSTVGRGSGVFLNCSTQASVDYQIDHVELL